MFNHFNKSLTNWQDDKLPLNNVKDDRQLGMRETSWMSFIKKRCNIWDRREIKVSLLNKTAADVKSKKLKNQATDIK